MHINHNGKILCADEPVLRADNRAFRYGWGLFETMLVQDGAIRLAQYHWERLIDGAATLGMHLSKLMDAAFFEKEVMRTVRKNGLENLARVRLQLYKGHGGLLDKETEQPGFVIECFPIEAHITALNTAGLSIGFAEGVRKSADNIAGLKTSSALIYAIAGEEARRNKWNDALVLNTSGRVIESTIANLFWVKDGIVHTPPLSDGCVAGVMRRHILQKLPGCGIEVCQTSIHPAELKNVENIFLSNAIRGLRWVGSCAGQGFEAGIATKITRELF